MSRRLPARGASDTRALGKLVCAPEALAVPVPAQCGHRVAVAGVGVEPQHATVECRPARALPSLPQGHLSEGDEEPAMRGRQGRTLAEQISRPARARLVRFPQERAGRPRRSGDATRFPRAGCSGTKPSFLTNMREAGVAYAARSSASRRGRPRVLSAAPKSRLHPGPMLLLRFPMRGQHAATAIKTDRSGQSFRRSLFDYPFRHASAGTRRL